MIKIRNSELDSNVFLAPMAGITDISFREIAISMGCSMVYSEMVSAKALHYGSENTKELLRISPKEKPIAVQLFGSEKEILSEIAAKLSENEDIVLIDINMGCPAPKLVKNGEGSSLMLDPKKAAEIISEVKKRRTNLSPVNSEEDLKWVMRQQWILPREWKTRVLTL